MRTNGGREAVVLSYLGVWAMALPFLGFPYRLKKILFFATGLCVASVAYLWHRRARKKGREDELKKS